MFGDVLTYGLRGKCRRDWEVDLKYGVKKNHMIILESIECQFFEIYYISLYIYLDLKLIIISILYVLFILVSFNYGFFVI